MKVRRGRNRPGERVHPTRGGAGRPGAGRCPFSLLPNRGAAGGVGAALAVAAYGRPGRGVTDETRRQAPRKRVDDAVDAALEELGLPRQAAAAQARPAREESAPSTPPPADGLAAQREAAAQLGAALRALTDASVRTLASTATLLDVAARITECLPALTADQRDVGDPAPLDDPAAKLWLYNPVIGRANPIAPWLETTLVDGVLTGRATLGLPYQGPRGYVHGGVSALLLDQVLGDVVSASGRSGLTVSLSTRYRGPIPLLAPLLVVGRVVEVADRKITAAGTIALESEPDRPLVEGVGVFVVPRPDQAARLFGAFGGPARDTPGTPDTPGMPAAVPALAVPPTSPSTT